MRHRVNARALRLGNYHVDNNKTRRRRRGVTKAVTSIDGVGEEVNEWTWFLGCCLPGRKNHLATLLAVLPLLPCSAFTCRNNATVPATPALPAVPVTTFYPPHHCPEPEKPEAQRACTPVQPACPLLP